MYLKELRREGGGEIRDNPCTISLQMAAVAGVGPGGTQMEGLEFELMPI